MLHVKNLSYTYKNDISSANTKAIDDVSFCVKPGEILGIIGKTGSGKSTLVRMLNGLVKPSKGNVYLNEKDIHKDFKNLKDVFLKVGLVFQYPEHQLFQRTVFDDIAFGLQNKGLSTEKIKEVVYETAKLLNISSNILSSSPLVLSGGEKRKCAIAGIVALKPDVLILDEPTAGMDFRSRKGLLEFLKYYCSTGKKSVIFISHVMEEVAEVSQNILVMNEGKSVFYGKTKEIFKKTNELQTIGLKIPQISKIMKGVNNHGYNVSNGISNVDDAKKELLKLLKKGELL